MNMAEISIPEEEFGEPELNYWKPVPKTLPATPPPFVPNYSRSPPKHLAWSYPNPAPVQVQYNQSVPVPMASSYPQTSYPLTDVVKSYINNQQIGLSAGEIMLEGERRRLPQYSQVNTEQLLYTLSTNPNFEQNSQVMTDNMIHDEVTRAAKTLFSKRNRTLLHWLNPDINKNQIKIDVNAAWDSLPTAEKVFYISQVLGKFAPHTTSLMVNPQLEPSKKENGNGTNLQAEKVEKTNNKTNTTNESKCSSDIKVRNKPKKYQTKSKVEKNTQSVKVEIKSEDEGSCDSGLVVDMEGSEQPKVGEPGGEKPRVKRKYTKRKHKENGTLERSAASVNGDSCPLPVDVKEIKVEASSKSATTSNNNLPRVKRKYIKRKLVRKKYKRREPKNQSPANIPVFPQKIDKVESIAEPVQDNTDEMEMDLWIELGNDSVLTNEEVDRFFDSIEDPDSLFRELGIIEN